MAYHAHARSSSTYPGWNAWSFVVTMILALSGIWVPVANAARLLEVDLQSRALVSFAQGVELRVLPIGDSITNGTHWSTDAGSYRSRLYSQMKQQFSNTIHFVGAEFNGNFTENHHEGHSGGFIRQIEALSQVGIYKAANIVLLHAGTNDMDRGVVSNAIPDLIHLINTILDKSATATVFVCQIIPAKTTATDNKIIQFNKNITSQVMPQFQGKKVVLVDMNTGFSKSNLQDSLHPTDAGYQDMANRFFKSLTSNEKLIGKPGTARNPPSAAAN